MSGVAGAGGRSPAATYRESKAALLERPGLSGPVRRRALARLTDGWLGELAAEAGVNVGGVALVAVGGFGRGELSPYSDLDLVLLHSTETPASYAEMLAQRLWYPIWDSKVRLDHSVRSVGGARQIARQDLPAVLGMLDLRHIAGDPDLATALHRRVLADWRTDARDRLPALLASCRERAERSGELAFATSPDLKESRGGLRDLVVMRAVAASWVADCPHQGLEEARSALLDVRDALHAVTSRATDRLPVQEQDPVAALLGLDDRDALLTPHRGHRPRRRARQRADLAPGRPECSRAPRGAKSPSWVGVSCDGRSALRWPTASSSRTGKPYWPVRSIPPRIPPCRGGLPPPPRRPASRCRPRPCNGWPVRPSPCPNPGRGSRWTPFSRCSASGEPMITAWEGLDQAGLISVLLPGWERLRSLPQRDPIHLYTVDRHLMQTAVNASGLVRRVSRPDLLLLARHLPRHRQGAAR